MTIVALFLPYGIKRSRSDRFENSESRRIYDPSPRTKKKKIYIYQTHTRGRGAIVIFISATREGASQQITFIDRNRRAPSERRRKRCEGRCDVDDVIRTRRNRRRRLSKASSLFRRRACTASSCLYTWHRWRNRAVADSLSLSLSIAARPKSIFKARPASSLPLGVSPTPATLANGKLARRGSTRWLISRPMDPKRSPAQ